MGQQSLWAGTAPQTQFPICSGEITTDVVIIGGGITGITAALELAEAGKSVVVLEAYTVGSGTTGYSTGNLYANLDRYLYPIRNKWGKERAREVASSRSVTVDRIEHYISRYAIDCSFHRCPLYMVAVEASQITELKKEHEALQEAGLKVSLSTDVPLPIPFVQGLRVENQAQFHPLAYVRGLAMAAQSHGCRIFEHSTVVDIDEKMLVVSTTSGRVKAQQVIIATHTPKGFNLIQTELGPYREYALAATLAEDRYPEGIVWTMGEPGHSIRSYNHGGHKYLIIIGEKHKTGQHDPNVDYPGLLEQFTRAHFGGCSIDYRWSAQNYRPADHLPYIGRTASSSAVFIASGFETDGLVYGALAASIITDQIQEKESHWGGLYKATRVNPVKGGKSLVEENINVAAQYVKDYLTKAQMAEMENIAPGEGGVVKLGGEQVAVYRSEGGAVTSLSPVCTHLGCIVHWNNTEKSWDCPCHGSRFDLDGEVIEGPAIKALKKKEP